MCGIAGIIDYKNAIDMSDAESMLSALYNRGPDEEGLFLSQFVALCHKRLAVVDIEFSKQPMTREHEGEKYTIVYNGELYNTEEIRKLLGAKGFFCSTDGDTEVVLLSFIAFGEKCLDLFNGIFAFAIWQENTKQLFFARDMMGVKPFFYFEENDKFIFASTVPALLKNKCISPTINITSVSEIMLLGPGRSPESGIFTAIKELPKGFCGFYSQKGLELKEYFTLKDTPHTDNFENTVEKVNFLVTDAITRQLISDVPIGTFLSGGLDSSIISAVASEKMREKNKTLDTFSVTYKNHASHFKASHFQPDSDEEYIDIMVKHIKSNHHEIVLDTADLIDALYPVIDEKGLPAMADVDSSLLAFCKEIKKHVTVALSGECADEIFGGYPWYRDKEIRDKNGFPWAQNTSYRMEFISNELKDRINSDYVQKKYNKAIENVSIETKDLTEKRMREMFVLNLDHFMQTLLFRKDSCSMHSSLEVRVPFCDRRITEYLYSVPWEYKNYKDREKGLLRQAFTSVLPEKVLWRKKSPYPKTHNPMYLSALREIFSSIINDPGNMLWSIVNIEKAKTLLYEEKALPWYGQLMTTPQTIAYFIQLEYWLRKFSVKLV